MKRIVAGLVLALLIASPVAAAPQAPSGTIDLQTAAPTYQQPVTFEWSVSGKLKGYQYPLIYVECYQDVKVYGQLDYPDTAFILGGGSSLWVTRGGGDAECIAHLYIYPGFHSAPIIELDTASFPAIHKAGLFQVSTASSSLISFETVLNADANVISGDTLQVTWTITLS